MVSDIAVSQILALSGDGASCAEISEVLGIEEERVKLALAANNAGSASDRDISDEQLSALRRRAFNLAMLSEDDSVAAKMTMFLIERDKPRLTTTPVHNVTLINNAIISAQEKAKQLASQYADSDI